MASRSVLHRNRQMTEAQNETGTQNTDVAGAASTRRCRRLRMRREGIYNHRMTSNTALYNIEKRGDGWAVIDVRTGVAAVENGVQLIGMSLAEADDLADLLTSREWKAETAQ